MTKDTMIPETGESLALPVVKHTVVGGVPLSQDVAEYAARENLIPFMEIAVELARASFPSIEAIGFELHHDAENGDILVVLDVTVRVDLDGALASSRKFLAQWVERVPWPQCDRLILSYHVA